MPARAARENLHKVLTAIHPASAKIDKD